MAVDRRQRGDAIEGRDDGLGVPEVEAFLRSKKTFSSNSGSFCFWYCLEAETEPLLDEVRPLSQPTFALVLDSETV